MEIGGGVDVSGAANTLKVEAPRQLPYVFAATLTKLAWDVRAGFQERMPEVFDRPVDFTVRGVRVEGATRDTLTAQVYIPDSDEEHGKALREYLRPGVEGTYRRQQKKTEFLLSRLGILPPGWVTTPGKGAKLDGYGNLSGRVYAQIINVLQLKAQVIGGRTVAERSAKRAKKLGVEAEYFAVAPGANKLGKNGGWLPPGVWKHLPGHKITQILKFIQKASYKPRLKLREEAAPVVDRMLATRWSEAAIAIASKFAKGR
jgi:hypothetical protein